MAISRHRVSRLWIATSGTAARRLLGMTVMPGPQLADALPVCRELRRRHPALAIVWGGYFPTMHP